MPTPNGIQLAFGGSNDDVMRGTPETVAGWETVLRESGVDRIDTAHAYESSETNLGASGLASKFTIDTKMTGGFSPDPSTKEQVIKSGRESLEKLKINQVDIYYLHTPDTRVPILDTLTGCNELYKAGMFKRLGISNFSAAQVEEVVSVAKANNLVVPSVYQGNYSAITRLIESEIFPVIRKHGIAFFAYSPIAGGLLAKDKDTLYGKDSRFTHGGMNEKMYQAMYAKDIFLDALGKWAEIAVDEGISKAELAYRWTVYHSQLREGDGVIAGARTHEQMRGTVEFIKKGPLSEGSVKRIAEVWDMVKGDVYLDNFEFFKQQGVVPA